MKTATRFELRPIAELIPYANNAKTHPPEQIKALRRSLQEFGFVSPVVIDEAGNVIAGHGRLLAAQANGETVAPCVIADYLTEEQRRAYILADNKLSEMGGWDEGLVKAEKLALQAAGFDITLTGFEPEGVSLEPGNEVEEDEADLILPAEPRTRRGDVWTLGRHRLVCGDSTSAADVHLAAGGGQIDLLVTDPPYGVDYQVSAKKGPVRPIENDDKKGEDLRAFLRAAFDPAADVMVPGAPFYVFGPSGPNQEEFYAAAREAGLPVHQLLIWVKPQLVLGRSDYQNRHEVCLHGSLPELPENYEGYESCAYGWKPGAAHRWCSDRKQTTVLEFDKPARSKEHPTMKPVKLIAYLICNSSLPDAVVFDPFGGSGTTLIACEQTGRTCRMIEIDPRYCDVIVDRWEQLTGQKAVLEHGTED